MFCSLSLICFFPFKNLFGQLSGTLDIPMMRCIPRLVYNVYSYLTNGIIPISFHCLILNFDGTIPELL